MTPQKFWAILRKAKGQWKILEGNRIRTNGQYINTVCPVCYVANTVLGQEIFGIDVRSASERIGLDLIFAKKIALAADHAGRKDRPRKIENKGLFSSKTRKALESLCK